MASEKSFSGDEEQWGRSRARIRTRGMTFEVFLPDTQADWLRAKIAGGVFKDAREAAFIAKTP